MHAERECPQVFHRLTYIPPTPAGAVGSGGVHQGREGHRVAAVCGNDPDADRGPAGRVPQADEHGQAAHLCGNRQRALRVPAAGEALHGPHHHQEQQHPGGSRDTQTVLPRGKKTREDTWNI